MEKVQEMTKSVTFILTQKASPKPPFYPPTVTIVSKSKVFDKQTKKERLAIYSASATSIWVDEIPYLKEEKNPRGDAIVFKNGMLTVSTANKNLLDFLRVCGKNEANSDTNLSDSVLFREINVEKKAKESYQNIRELDNARSFVSNTEERQLRAYAIAMAKDLGEVSMVQRMSEYELRLHLRHKAETNPRTFIENLKNELLSNKVVLIKAQYEDIIVLNEDENTLSWKNGGVFFSAPKGFNVIDYLADSATKTANGLKLVRDVQDQINDKNNLKPTTKKKEDIVLEDIKSSLGLDESDSAEFSVESLGITRFTMELIAKDVVEKNGVWCFYQDKKWKGVSALEADIIKNKDFQKELIEVYKSK